MRANVHDPIESFEEDLLERKILAEAILRRLGEVSCPSVLGLYGGWGSGKTSLVNLICTSFRDENKSAPLHIEVIDAWQYEVTGNLLIPIVVRLKHLYGNKDLPEGWKACVRRVLAVTSLSLIEAALGAVGSVTLGDIRDTWKDIEQADEENASGILYAWEKLTDEVTETQRAFARLIEAVLAENHWSRLVLCVDNLDRCSPERAVHLLESVKNFLAVPGCIWLFAMDSNVVASYIDKKYEGTAMNGYSFLDKIIPEQYHLSFSPEQNDRRIFDFISEATGGITLRDEKRLPQLPQVMVPRRLKKSAVKFADYFKNDLPDADRDTVFLLCLLYHTWPDFYERLSSPSIEHIGGILANYFKNRMTEDQGWQWGGYSPAPLDKSFTEDQELNYFLKTAFPNYRQGTGIVEEIHRALAGLRQIGLP